MSSIASPHRPAGRRIKRRILATCGSLLAATAIAAATAPAANADGLQCPTRYACAWSTTSGIGALVLSAADGGRLIWPNARKLVMKNQFENRPVLSWNGLSAFPETCLDPGERTQPGFLGAVLIYVGLAGTGCAF